MTLDYLRFWGEMLREKSSRIPNTIGDSMLMTLTTSYVVRVEPSYGTGVSYLIHQNCCRKELREDISGTGLMVSKWFSSIHGIYHLVGSITSNTTYYM